NNPSILKQIAVERKDGLYYEMVGETFTENFKEHYLCSGMYAFGYMDAFKECMPDPRTFFYGEEQLLALRLSTRCWRIFSFQETYLFHKGMVVEEELIERIRTDKKFWRTITDSDDYLTAFSNSDLEHKNDPLSGVTYDILSGKELGYWGAPDLLSYIQYVDKLGFDYRALSSR
ncbi:MAG: GlcNAc-transferase family protein, partial [bacterium]